MAAGLEPQAPLKRLSAHVQEPLVLSEPRQPLGGLWQRHGVGEATCSGSN